MWQIADMILFSLINMAGMGERARYKVSVRFRVMVCTPQNAPLRAPPATDPRPPPQKPLQTPPPHCPSHRPSQTPLVL